MPNETNPQQVDLSALTEGKTDAIEITIPADKDVYVITHPENVKVELVPAPDPEPEPPTMLDNALTLGIVGVLALAVVAVVIRRLVSGKKAAAAAPVVEEAAPVVEAPTAPGAAGELKLHNVEPKTAAMLMAIVADKLGKPVNELRFISIKEVE